MPDYDIVKVRSRARRSVTGGDSSHIIHLRAFGKDHALNLQLNDQLIRGGQVPLYFADKDQYGSVVVTQSSPSEVRYLFFYF